MSGASLAADLSAVTLESVARLIQLSLAPVFLLSALAALLGVFAGRLARVADRVDAINVALESAGLHEARRLRVELAYQRRRTLTLDVAVVLAAVGGALTGVSVLVLFLGGISGWPVAPLLFLLFGAAIVSAVGALGAFVYEMLLASRGVRRRSETPVAEETAQRTRPVRRRPSED